MALQLQVPQVPQLGEVESFLGTQIVDLYVGTGEERKHFPVHKNVIDRIPYFNSMFNNGMMKESLTFTAEFPEDIPWCFEMLLYWAYRYQCPELKITPDNALSWDPVPFYELADKLCIFRLCDEITDEYLHQMRNNRSFPTLLEIEHFYKTAAEGSMFRRIASHALHYILTQCHSNESLSQWSVEGVRALLNRQPCLMKDYLTLVREQNPEYRPANTVYLRRCHFHRHGADERCYLDD